MGERDGAVETGRAMRVTGRPPVSAAIAVGGISGLAWAASLRGWMAQIAGHDSTFSWVGTFGVILLPGAVVGAALGWAMYLGRTGGLRGRRRRWLIASPLLLASGVLDPPIFHALITSGAGSGAVGVAITGLLGGYALAPHGRRWFRIGSGLLATLTLIASTQIGAEALPLSTPHGAWVAVQVASLLALLCLACSIPHRAAPPPQDAPALVDQTAMPQGPRSSTSA